MYLNKYYNIDNKNSSEMLRLFFLKIINRNDN